jgi:hypothetical protein
MPAAHGGRETPYNFKAAETGAFRIVCEPRSWTATVNSPGRHLCLYSQSARFHLLGTTGRFWFWVPPGTKEFGVKVSGEEGTERIKAGLYDPAGGKLEEKDNIAEVYQFVASIKDPSSGGIWSLRFDKPGTGVLEDFYVHLQGLPPLLSPARESLLRPAN